MSAQITVSTDTDMPALVAAAGGTMDGVWYDGAALHVPGVSQEALDAALAAYVPVVRTPVRTIAPLDFLSRFTDAEKAAVYTARRSVWQVDDFITQLAATPVLTLDDGTGKPDARISAGVQFLVAAGLLSADRAAAVIAP